MLLAMVVLVALLLAGAAVLLLGTTDASYGSGGSGGGGGSGSPQTQGQLSINLPAEVWAVLFLSPFLVGLAGMIYRRLTNPGIRGLGMFLMIILVGILLVALLHLGTAGPGSVSVGVGPPGGNNSTNHSQNNTTQGGGGSGGTPGTTSPINIQIPTWSVWLVAAVVCGGVLLFAIPAVASRILDRTRRSDGLGGAPPDRGDLANVVGEAAAALERGEDPRETIVQLYVQLLLRLSMVTGTMASETPEEIRQNHLVPLGVPVPVAATMTRIFEEARYSTHPIAPATVDAAQVAMRAAEAALRAREPVAA